jgi:hypothetical protein
VIEAREENDAEQWGDFLKALKTLPKAEQDAFRATYIKLLGKMSFAGDGLGPSTLESEGTSPATRRTTPRK